MFHNICHFPYAQQVLSQFNVKDIVKYDGDREKCLVTVKLKGRQFTFITEDQSAADGILRILEQFEEEYNWQVRIDLACLQCTHSMLIELLYI